jgi:hypothetical protein
MGVVSTGCDEVGIGVASRFSMSWTSSKMKCSSDVSEFDTYFTWSSKTNNSKYLKRVIYFEPE